MHPRTHELLEHLQRCRAALQAAVDATPQALRERKPAPDRWSAAEVLEHLATVEAQVATLLKRGLRAAMERAPLPPDDDSSPVVPTLDARSLLDRERRLQARPRTMPTCGLTAAQAWSALRESRAELRDVVLAGDGLDTRSIRAAHPFLGELTFQQWIVFLGYHEVRHAAQIEATAAALLPPPQA